MRPHNILMKLPGVVDQGTLNAKAETDCWDLLFSTILNLIVTYTNQHIDSVKERFQRERDCRPTDLIEIKAWVGYTWQEYSRWSWKLARLLDDRCSRNRQACFT